MDIERITRGTPATLSVTFYGDENPMDADTGVQVTVRRADGSTLVGPVSATHAGTGTYTYGLPGQTALNILSADWTGTFGGLAASVTTSTEVVGGHFFTLGELRGSDSILANTTKYTTAMLEDARLGVETDFEQWTNRSFTGKFARLRFEGEGLRHRRFYVEHIDARQLLSITVDGVSVDVSLFRQEQDNPRRMFTRDYAFPWRSQVYVEYEHGMPFVPNDIKRAAMKLARYRLGSTNARIDERAMVMQVDGFGSFRLATPGQRGSYCGIPEVDIVLANYHLDGIG